MPKITDIGVQREFSEYASPSSHVLGFLSTAGEDWLQPQRLLVFRYTGNGMEQMAAKHINVESPEDAARVFDNIREALPISNLDPFDEAISVLAFVSMAYVGLRREESTEAVQSGEPTGGPRIGDDVEDSDSKVCYAVIPGGGRSQSALLNEQVNDQQVLVQLEPDSIESGHVSTLPEEGWQALSNLLDTLNRGDFGSRSSDE